MTVISKHMRAALLVFFFVTVFIVGDLWPIKAQKQVSMLNNLDQRARVGLVDEFFDRFNGNAFNPALDGEDRLRNLIALFDQNQFSVENDVRFNDAKRMADKIINDSIVINYSDSTWIALAHCNGKLDGKAVKFDLFLTVQGRGKDMYKWVISRADGSIFDITPTHENEKIMLYPDDHETNFMSLKRVCEEQPSDIRNFLRRSFEYEPTSVFAYLVYNGKLKIDYVDELEFVFTQVPGYMFHVRNFDRKGFNSGWLISNFYEFSPEDKESFLNYVRPGRCGRAYSLIGDDKKTLEDSLMLKSNISESVYLRRLKERYSQIQDYLKFTATTDSTLKTYYTSKLINMFVPDSRVHIFDDQGVVKGNLRVASFCEFVGEGNSKVESIDSLYVPVWIDKTLAKDSTKSFYETKGRLVAIRNGELIDLLKEDRVETPDRTLYIFKEETEDGEEWIALFGDIYITIKE